MENIHQAVAEYEALGFTVNWEADSKTAHNAMIYLADGSFLELFAVPEAGIIQRFLVKAGSVLGNPLLKRFSLYLSAAPWLTDFALDTVGDFPVRCSYQAGENGTRLSGGQRPYYAQKCADHPAG